MKLGRLVRRMAGPLEPRLTTAYRDFFFDVDGFAAEIAGAFDAQRVVEIGCGEGALLSALSARMPASTFLGLDVSENVGRLFEGDRSRVSFECADAMHVAGEQAASADLVLICDVMHHVPVPVRPLVWSAATALAKPGGAIVLKEWLRYATPIYWIGYASDRFVTGDRVQYQSRDEWIAEVNALAPSWSVTSEMGLRPWNSNHAFVLQRQAGVLA